MEEKTAGRITWTSLERELREWAGKQAVLSMEYSSFTQLDPYIIHYHPHWLSNSSVSYTTQVDSLDRSMHMDWKLSHLDHDIIKQLVISIQGCASPTTLVTAIDFSIASCVHVGCGLYQTDECPRGCWIDPKQSPSRYSTQFHTQTMCWVLPDRDLLSLWWEDQPTGKFTSGSPLLREQARSWR